MFQIAASSKGHPVDPQLLGATASLVGLNPQIQLFGAIVACVVALLSHGGKAGTRTAVNVTGGGFTLAGVAISLLEDLVVAIVAFLALRYPLAANLIAGAILLVMIVVVPQLPRWAWFTLLAIVARLKTLAWSIRQPEPLPPDHAALLGSRPVALSAQCQAQGEKAIRGRSGYLALAGDCLAFTYRRWLRSRLWLLPLGRVRGVALQRRILLLVLEIAYHNGRAPQTVRFGFTADRTPLAEQFVGLLNRPTSANSAQVTSPQA